MTVQNVTGVWSDCVDADYCRRQRSLVSATAGDVSWHQMLYASVSLYGVNQLYAGLPTSQLLYDKTNTNTSQHSLSTEHYTTTQHQHREATSHMINNTTTTSSKPLSYSTILSSHLTLT